MPEWTEWSAWLLVLFPVVYVAVCLWREARRSRPRPLAKSAEACARNDQSIIRRARAERVRARVEEALDAHARAAKAASEDELADHLEEINRELREAVRFKEELWK